MGMTDEEKFRFDLNGFLVRPAILAEDEIAALVDQIDRIHHDPESLPAAARAKFKANALKYPADAARGTSAKYTELPSDAVVCTGEPSTDPSRDTAICTAVGRSRSIRSSATAARTAASTPAWCGSSSS